MLPHRALPITWGKAAKHSNMCSLQVGSMQQRPPVCCTEREQLLMGQRS